MALGSKARGGKLDLPQVRGPRPLFTTHLMNEDQLNSIAQLEIGDVIKA